MCLQSAFLIARKIFRERIRLEDGASAGVAEFHTEDVDVLSCGSAGRPGHDVVAGHARRILTYRAVTRAGRDRQSAYSGSVLGVSARAWRRPRRGAQRLVIRRTS